MTDPCALKPGDVVQQKSNPERVGIVRAVKWDPQLCEWTVRVQFGTSIRGVSVDDLACLPEACTPWEAVEEGRMSGASHFKDVVTFERLRRPPARIADSFGSARAQLLPYQFIPLLKFLESTSRRLLIADDVGLGKTLEAGYILRELRRQRELDRILIVVPARLRTKWKMELERRFDERFELASSRDIHDFIRGLGAQRPREAFRWISSYESLRKASFIEAFEEYAPPIDLLIFDEAHRLRNPGTLQHRLGRCLSESADSLLFLTATPIQTKLENLFELLRLLEPQRFSHFEAFEEQIKANKPVLRALSCLQTDGAGKNRAADHLATLANHRMTKSLSKSVLFESILERAQRAASLSRKELVLLQQDVGQLSLTGELVSRTRKVDVQKDRPQREAQSFPVLPTMEELEVYGKVESICRTLHPNLEGWGAAMSALMAYRITASCIPAALEAFRAQIESVIPFSESIAEETESETGWMEVSEEVPDGEHNNLEKEKRSILASIKDPPVDSKYREFRRALETVWTADVQVGRLRRKAVVFSFFKRTLKYLARQLSDQGILYRLIDGDVPLPERESRIEEFAADPKILVLLSSEVGGEGLDLQFASVIVNYDLPWNPMVLEQRIGRVDRIGQRAPSIPILNLVLNGTVEHRILDRLYRRIGLFKETIGEIDPILGQTVQDLATKALLGLLTPEEEEQKLAQAESAIASSAAHASVLAEQADSLMAADQAFLDEIDALLGRRRVPSSAEVHRFLRNYLESNYSGASIPERTLSEAVEIRIPIEVASRTLTPGTLDGDSARVARRIEAGPFPATFSPDAAELHPRAEFLGSTHPLVRMAVEDMTAHNDRLTRAFALRLSMGGPSDRLLAPGLYGFSIWLLDFVGLRTKRELVPIFVAEGSTEVMLGENADDVLVRLLEAAEPLDPVPSISETSLRSMREAVIGAFQSLRNAREVRGREIDRARGLRRRQTLEGTLSMRVDRLQERLALLQARRAAPFAIHMTSAQIAKARSTLLEATIAPTEVNALRLEDEEIVSGVLVVD